MKIFERKSFQHADAFRLFASRVPLLYFHVFEKAPNEQILLDLQSCGENEEVILLDVPLVEQQLLGLVWRGGKIDHPGGEHDDWANAAAGALHLQDAATGLAVEVTLAGARDVAAEATAGYLVYAGAHASGAADLLCSSYRVIFSTRRAWRPPSN